MAASWLKKGVEAVVPESEVPRLSAQRRAGDGSRTGQQTIAKTSSRCS
jgi:hypothetical protein